MRNMGINMARGLWEVPDHIPDKQVWVYIDKKNYKKVELMVEGERRTYALKTLEYVKSRHRYHG